MDSKKNVTPGITSRPRIEDVLKPPTQIISHIDGGTLPRKFAKPTPIQSEPLKIVANVNNGKDRGSPQKVVANGNNGKDLGSPQTPSGENPFIRWRSFNSGLKYPSTPKSPIAINGLRPNGLDKLLAKEEQEKQKALSIKPLPLNRKTINSSQSSPLLIKEAEDVQINGIFKAKPVYAEGLDSRKLSEKLDSFDGIYKAEPVYVEDQDCSQLSTNIGRKASLGNLDKVIEEESAEYSKTAPPKPSRNTKAQKDLQLAIGNSTSSPAPRNSNPNIKSEKDIQEAIKILLEAASTKALNSATLQTPAITDLDEENPSNSSMHLNLPGSSSIIVININNVNNNLETPQINEPLHKMIEKSTINHQDNSGHNTNHLNSYGNVDTISETTFARNQKL
ncbi:uncharacterized protein LOC142229608 [Haematobia irritans]|uniref:uncharacterized protein LOC142229608 n=1 Tax=Haematobia irritans TaxID=7368 RepID=UPI003F508E1D